MHIACFVGLVTALNDRYQHTGEPADIEEQVGLCRIALAALQKGNTSIPMVTKLLGSALRTRHERLSDVRDLEDAVTLHKEALDLSLRHHLTQHTFTHELGVSLYFRFLTLGHHLPDLNQSVDLQREALKLCGDDSGSEYRPHCFAFLAFALSSRFEIEGQITDLTEAIQLLQGVMDLWKLAHRDWQIALNAMGRSYTMQFERFNEMKSLSKANDCHRNALELRAVGHPNQIGTLLNVAGA